MMKAIKSAKGFTMIELMVVLVIIGILAAILVPQLLDSTAKAKCGEIPPAFAGFDHAVQVVYHETNAIPSGNSSDIAFTAPSTSKWFSYEQVATAGKFCVATKGTKVGIIDPNTNVAMTVNSESGNSVVAVHTVDSDYKKYLSSFDAGAVSNP